MSASSNSSSVLTGSTAFVLSASTSVFSVLRLTTKSGSFSKLVGLGSVTSGTPDKARMPDNAPVPVGVEGMPESDCLVAISSASGELNDLWAATRVADGALLGQWVVFFCLLGLSGISSSSPLLRLR